MSFCDGLIAKDILDASCTNPAKKGYERIGILINREDIDFSSVTFSSTAKNRLTAMALKSGKKGFKVVQKGQTPFGGTTTEAEVGTYGTFFNKNVQIAILNNDAETADGVIDSLANGEFVMILEAKDKGEENSSAFIVVGLHNGLVMSADAEDFNGDTAGGALVTLTETGASQSRVYLGTSYATGKTLFDSFLEEAE